ncbi:MAG TPA: M48 family metallopeptidase [Candidatus Binatia bacterium]
MACFLFFFVLVGLSIDYLYLDAFTPGGPSVPIATLIALGFSAAVSYTGYRQGGRWILSSVGAEPLDIQIPEHRELHNIVKEMALASGCRMPKVYVAYDPAPNAFATGCNEESASICITTGLLILLGREETQGVVAHEMAHIKNNDTSVMLLISVLLGGVVLLSDWARRSIFGARPLRRASGPALLAIPALLLIVISPLVSRLMAMAVSRQREYLADATAVEFTRNPRGLARALEKIRDSGMPCHKATRGTAHLFFVNPLRRRIDGSNGKLADLLSSHPPINRRILMLYQMGALPGSAAQLGIEAIDAQGAR